MTMTGGCRNIFRMEKLQRGKIRKGQKRRNKKGKQNKGKRYIRNRDCTTKMVMSHYKNVECGIVCQNGTILKKKKGQEESRRQKTR